MKNMVSKNFFENFYEISVDPDLGWETGCAEPPEKSKSYRDS